MSEESTTQAQGCAEQTFNQFCDSNNFREILQLFTSLCSEVGLDPSQYDGFYQSLKSSFTSWKATSLFQLLDARTALPEYDGGKACAGKRVLVVGAGPVGLRGAIELVLLGAKVDLVEKRPDFQRNNSLHLWPFLITDLRNLGAKKFYGRFASGSIDHICIRILQAILLKVCLLLGVKVHAGVTFKGIIEPTSSQGWWAETTPTTTPISSNDYDVILAADGKQNSVPGFHVKEFRAKLALAITVNFVNHNTQQENSVPEIGGVAFVYRQDFFNNLAKTHGIELENIVYYKDETHYFVMTVRKQSLLRKGVLIKDNNDPKQLLSSSNIDRKQLENFALEATCFSTEGGLGEVEFEKNHRGENDVALFDFTSLFAAENAARIVERKGRRLLLCLAGDSLIEPFWPTGSGCARGFLGVFDNAWMVKKLASEAASPIELIEEREAILYLLPQTTPRRLSSNFHGYTIDPKTRYLNLSELVPPGDVSHLYDTDNQNAIAMVKNRISVAPSTQDKPKPATENETVEPTIKRSKSSEVLSSEAHSATTSPQHTSTSSHPHIPEPSSADVKYFWQKRLSVKDDKSPQKKESSKDTASDKESKPVTKDSKAASKDVKAASKEPKTVLKDSKAADKDRTKVSKAAPKDSKPSFKDAKAVAKDTKTGSKAITKDSKVASKALKQSSKSSPPKGRESPVRDLSRLTPAKQTSPQHKASATKVSSKPPPSPRAIEDSLHRAKTISEGKASKQAPSSPKWSRLFSKGRARSESPERSPKHDKKSEKDPKSLKDHPLKVTRSLQDIDKEAKGDQQVNVFDIVKKYDLRAESLTRGEVGKGKQSSDQATAAKVESGKQPSVKAVKESAEKSRKTDSPKVKKTDKTKGDKKSKDDKKSDKLKEDKKASKESKGGFFSRFKSRKSYDVSGASAKDKKLLLSSADDKPLNELSEQPIVQRRIDQLKQIGMMTDGAEDTDVVLVGVSPLTEAVKEEERSNDVEEQQSDSAVEPEGEVPASEGNSPVSDAAGEQPVTGEDEYESERGNSPEEEATKNEVEDSIGVKQLKEVFSKRDHVASRHLSMSLKRSKEIDLSDVPSQKSKSASSHPLWLARVIQGMSKCLERLRKEHEIMTVKTALEILNTILSNVQAHPDSDVYRRVRVSSEAFSNKVWQLSEASQFLARAGWVQIEEFIVLPMDANVDNAKRVLDKHLNIVNQMLWSRQLELPQLSPEGVVMRPPTDTRLRNRVASLTRRESYATRLVDESLQRIEEDTANMLTAGDSFPAAEDETDLPSTKTDGEEEQMLRSASVARNIWKQRNESQDMGRASFSTNGSKERLISESVLYDLPLQPKLSTDSIKTQLPSVSEDTAGVPTEESTDHQAFDLFEERLKKLNQSRKASGGSINSQTVGEITKTENASAENGRETPVPADSVAMTAVDKEASSSPENTSSCTTPDESTSHELSENIETPPRASSPPPSSLLPSTSNHGDQTTNSLSPSNSSRGDQLRELLGTSPVSPLAQETTKNEADVKSTTDAQHSTDHSIRTERVEYGNLTMKAAAETREKWKQTEEASIEAQKTQTKESIQPKT